MIGRVINAQMFFTIPRVKLKIFLYRIYELATDRRLVYYEAEYIFQQGEFYDVIVNEYGSSPWARGLLEEFAKDLNRTESKDVSHE